MKKIIIGLCLIFFLLVIGCGTYQPVNQQQNYQPPDNYQSPAQEKIQPKYCGEGTCCGDGICQNYEGYEDCDNCEPDCGECNSCYQFKQTLPLESQKRLVCGDGTCLMPYEGTGGICECYQDCQPGKGEDLENKGVPAAE